MRYYLLFFIVTLFVYSSCDFGSKGDTHNCKMGKPAPMFSDTMKFVQQHQFFVQGNMGVETVHFDNMFRLEIYQSGCDKLKQEFRVTQPGKFDGLEDAFWVKGAYQSLMMFSGVSMKLAGLKPWAEIIQKNADKIKLAEPFSPEPGIQIVVDRIMGNKEATIIIQFEQI